MFRIHFVRTKISIVGMSLYQFDDASFAPFTCESLCPVGMAYINDVTSKLQPDEATLSSVAVLIIPYLAFIISFIHFHFDSRRSPR